MPIKKAEKDIGSSPIKPPTDKELGIGDDWLDDYDYYYDYYAEVLSKQQTLAEKKKIAEEYLAKEAEKKAKSGGNPLLIVNPAESSFNSLLQKAASIKGSSHDNSGPYGGSSSYTDEDVVQSRLYMQSVLGVESVSVNGRALEHILAEVYGFAKRDSIMALKAKQKNQDQLEMQIKQLKTTLGKMTEDLEQLQAEAKENEKFLAVSKKLDKETVAKTSTGRRIKE
jgi:chromosome segregation ATPase